MPKQEIDYTNTIMYKIVCKDLNITDVYIGHTANFRSRKNCHKTRCNNENDQHYNYHIYKTIRENGGWENWDMIEIEKYPCNDSNEARKRERYWYELNHATLNTCYPDRTIEEWYVDNKERIQQYSKTEKVKQSVKQYQEKIKQYKQEYREKNIESINEKRRSIVICACGSSHVYNDKA